MDALLAAYERFKTAAYPTLASYARALPALPTKGLEASGSYPQARDLWDGVAIALLLTLARILLTALVLDHVGRACMKHRYYRIKRQAVPVIDAALRENKLPMLHEKKRLAKEAGLTVEEASDYMRRWRNADREARALHKFTEVSWKFMIHVAVTFYGLRYIATQDYAWDLRLCWTKQAITTVPREVYWYYMAEIGIYVHESIYLGIEARRKDFREYVVHHIATLSLLGGSFLYGFTRIGALVAVLHDAADSLLELAKLFNYVSNARPWAQRVTDSLFTSFAVVFAITRNLLFPCYIIRHCIADFGTLLPDILAVKVFIGFMCVLAALHVFWMSMIVKMAIKMAREGAATKDDRSEDESYLEQSITHARSTYEKED